MPRPRLSFPSLLSILSILSILLSIPPSARAASVVPATATANFIRDEAVAQLASASFYEASTLRLTNCVAYSSTNAVTRQDLTAVTISIDIGSSSTNVTYSGTAQLATNGTFWATLTVPSGLPQTYLQLKLTDGSGNSYIYPWKIVTTKSSL